MEFPPLFQNIYLIFTKLLYYKDVFVLIVPDLLQLLGIIGWIWNGYKIITEYRWQQRISGFIKSTIVFLLGVYLKYFLEFYPLLI